MKRFLEWTTAIAGIAIGTVFMARAVRNARERLRSALGEAEAIADRTRATLEQTESALHRTREAI